MIGRIGRRHRPALVVFLVMASWAEAAEPIDFNRQIQPILGHHVNG